MHVLIVVSNRFEEGTRLRGRDERVAIHESKDIDLHLGEKRGVEGQRELNSMEGEAASNAHRKSQPPTGLHLLAPVALSYPCLGRQDVLTLIDLRVQIRHA